MPLDTGPRNIPTSELKPDFTKASEEKHLPKSLKLVFSEAADDKRINALFDPNIKGTIDPSQFISKRKPASFKSSIDNGCVAFLADENGDVMMMVIGYQIHMDDKHAPGDQHDYTELATAMSRLKGYRNADLISAALTLKEWWQSPPKKMIMASIESVNAAPQAMSHTLGWEHVTDPDTIEELFYPVYKTIIDDTGQNRDIPLPPEEEKAHVWFYTCTDKAVIKQAALLLQFLDKGGVVNKKTNHFIPVDFSALDDIGLTRERLETLAAGNLSRSASSVKKPKPPSL